MASKNFKGGSCKAEQLNEEIKKKAQEIYEKSGGKQGRDLENWLEAERLVKNKLSCR